MKKIVIIGSGIAGTSSAYYLQKKGYDITVFEAADYFGGHTNTIEIELDKGIEPIDTGFLVHNNRTYPNLLSFFAELDIKSHESDMSFSVNILNQGLEWSGSNLATIFSQKKNLLSLKFWRFLKEILRFNKNAPEYLKESMQNKNLSLGDLLEKYKYSDDFQKWYLLPMGGCIWSTPTSEMLKFPAYSFMTFCMNHGLLQIFDRPQWKTIKNGCRTYVKKALGQIDKKYLSTPVKQVEFVNNKVMVTTKDQTQEFDYCVFASHPPETLKIIKDIDPKSREILNQFKYQPNTAVVHLDKSVLPNHKSAWASWNYQSGKTDSESVSVTYLINMLQPLKTKTPVLVTLNPVVDIDSKLTLRTIQYEHPVFDEKAVAAQNMIDNIQGAANYYYCGAWQRYGFHEDGILSAKKMINHILKRDGGEPLEVL